MITKALVEKVIDKYHIKVRIPIYNRVTSSPMYTPTEELSVAVISTVPGTSPNLQVGDIVFVGFEDNDIGKPIILGTLFRDIDTRNFTQLSIDTIDIQSKATLPFETTIGKIQPSELACLSGIDINIADKLESLQQQIDNLQA